MEHALITGVSSTIGYEIARQLLEAGLFVHGTINRRTTKLAGKHENYRETSWTEFVGSAWGNLGPKSVIIHTAAVVPSRLGEHLSYDFNLQSTKELMELAESRHVPLLIFFSTMSVYGNIGVSQVVENLVDLSDGTSQTAIAEDYGHSKLQCEKLLKSMASDKTKVVVVRLPGVLGRRSDYNFISVTFQKLKKNLPITVKSPFACFNNLALDSDVGRLCQHLKDHLTNLPPFSVANFAAAGLYSVQEVILRLKELVNSDSVVQYADYGSNSFTISIQNLRDLGFEPSCVCSALTQFVQRYDQPIHI
jgi:nucleoside-diphosphate-sugar epimerase